MNTYHHGDLLLRSIAIVQSCKTKEQVDVANRYFNQAMKPYDVFTTSDCTYLYSVARNEHMRNLPR